MTANVTLYCLATLLSWPFSTSLNLISRLFSWISIVSTNFRSLCVRWSKTSMDWLMFWTWMKKKDKRLASPSQQFLKTQMQLVWFSEGIKMMMMVLSADRTSDTQKCFRNICIWINRELIWNDQNESRVLQYHISLASRWHTLTPDMQSSTVASPTQWEVPPTVTDGQWKSLCYILSFILLETDLTGGLNSEFKPTDWEPDHPEQTLHQQHLEQPQPPEQQNTHNIQVVHAVPSPAGFSAVWFEHLWSRWFAEEQRLCRHIDLQRPELSCKPASRPRVQQDPPVHREPRSNTQIPQASSTSVHHHNKAEVLEREDDVFPSSQRHVWFFIVALLERRSRFSAVKKNLDRSRSADSKHIQLH